MINRQQLKITLLGALAGYLASEYFILRHSAQITRQQTYDRRINLAKIEWARYMVEKECVRGRYDKRHDRGDITNAVTIDFDYYLLIAPDPRHH